MVLVLHIVVANYVVCVGSVTHRVAGGSDSSV